jgi:putative glutamine amidotransferase
MRPLIGLTTAMIRPDGSAIFERFGLAAVYCRAVAAAGGAPLLIPGLGDVEAARAVFPLLDGLLLTGGPDAHPALYGQEIHPGCEWIDDARDVTEMALMRLAQETPIPLFGICRGFQMMNIGFGGTLIQDIPTERPSDLDHRGSVPEPSRPAHDLRIEPGTRLAGALGTRSIPANSLHHQAIDELAPGFQISARSEDGLIEAIESDAAPFLLAVQCHPEHLYQHDPRWLRLFEAFVQAAAERHAVPARVAV